jgi:hypothetical protein
MSLDLTKLMSFAEASKTVPGRPHISTIQRWRLRGIKGVKLKTYLYGGKRFVDFKCLEEFFAGVNAAANNESIATRTPRQRQREIERAERELGT